MTLIRFLSDTERTAWQTMFSQYADFYKSPFDERIAQTVWQWIHDPDVAFDCLVAIKDNELVGFMHFYPVPSPLRGGHIGFLNDLFVAEAHRGSGVFEALFDKLAHVAKTRRWPLVRWNTAETNDRARAAYARVANTTHWKVYELDTTG